VLLVWLPQARCKECALKPVIDAAIAVIHRGPLVLICRRKANDTLGGYWEFPGGKQEHGETLEQCLSREMMEELAIGVVILRPLLMLEHDYPRARIRLHAYFCRLDAGEPTAIECDEFRWIAPGDLPMFRFPPANDPLFAEVVRAMRELG
jgi:mutator protein MutT